MSLYNYGLDYLLEHSPKYYIESDNTGIVTATDDYTFTGLKTLYSSVKNKINFVCVDIGLNKFNRKWCKDNGLNLLEITHPDCKHIEKWQTYLKPWFLINSPFSYTLWIDTDCIVTGDLSLSDFIKNQQTFFIKHWIKQKFLHKNFKELYETHPVPNSSISYINAGVFGINKTTHFKILEDWKNLIEEGFKNLNILKLLSNWDEGALNWSLQKNQLESLIYNDERYNCYASFLIDNDFHEFEQYEQKVLALEKSSSSRMFFKHVLEKSRDLFILHFSTCMNNRGKYWTAWES